MRNFLFKIVSKIRQFMYGRNGVDDLAKHSFIAYFIMFLIYGFCPYGAFKIIFGVITYSLMIYVMFRIFSKNIYKRVSENRKYMGALNMTKTRWNQRNTHRFYRCPKCKTWLRVPKNRGKITITCVKCSHKFDKRT